MNSILYEPKIGKVNIADCLQIDKYEQFCKEIDADDNLSTANKKILKLLATRFIRFRYEKLADYYANTNTAMKDWLEKLNCVIIDDGKALERGYFKYQEDYSNFLGGIVDEK